MGIIVTADRFFPFHYVVSQGCDSLKGLHILLQIVKSDYTAILGRVFAQKIRDEMNPRIEHHYKFPARSKFLQVFTNVLRTGRIHEKICYPAVR